jgi:hypothetical protein
MPECGVCFFIFSERELSSWVPGGCCNLLLCESCKVRWGRLHDTCPGCRGVVDAEEKEELLRNKDYIFQTIIGSLLVGCVFVIFLMAFATHPSPAVVPNEEAHRKCVEFVQQSQAACISMSPEKDSWYFACMGMSLWAANEKYRCI